MREKSLISVFFIIGLLLLAGWNVSYSYDDPLAVQNTSPSFPSFPKTTIPKSLHASDLGGVYNGGAAYDSGWVPINRDQLRVLTHNLGGNVNQYVVNLVYRNSDNDSGINQRYYGGADFGAHPAPGHNANDRVGAYWRSLNTTDIIVYRRPEDTYAEQIRLRIWVDSAPADYDSGWLPLTPGVVNTRPHGLGGNPDDYLVDLQYRNATSGINQRYYGGSDFGTQPPVGQNPDDQVGAYWYGLDNAQVRIYRRPHDTYAEEFRLRIWKRPRATYDSGWRVINPDQALALAHQIGGNVDDYVVYLECLSTTIPVAGVNHIFFGGKDTSADARHGAYWRSLTGSSIVVYRRPEDVYANQVRLRIFNAWKVPTPHYDSGWFPLGAGADATVLNHGIGGNADDYFVDLQYQGALADGINNRYYGGADFGTNPAPGHNANDRVGAYWRSLTNSSIAVFRRAEDTYAEQVRLRIWSMPKPDYDSGWTALAVDTATSFAHNLGGDPGEYLVDMQQRSISDGVNHRHYGGADLGSQPTPGLNADDRVGAYWRSLSATGITVYRRPEDIFASQLRIRIWRIAKPDYDSGWRPVAADTAQILSHNLGKPLNNFLVNMNYMDSDPVNSLNQRYFGGADFGSVPPAGYNADDRVGAYWRSLTADTITFYRRPQDGFADSVRIRIWSLPTGSLFLPLIFKN